MAGSPVKPTALRQGHRTRPELAALPPRSELGVPDPPTGLLKSSRKLWESYWGSPVASAALQVDLAGLERWIVAVDEWTRATKSLRKQRLVDGSMKQPRMNPLAAYAAEREKAILAYEERYGLNPQARLKLGIAAGQARMTAAQLNATLDEHDDPNDDTTALEARWSEA